MTTETNRREFEEWASDQTWLSLYGQSGDAAWEAWQAASDQLSKITEQRDRMAVLLSDIHNYAKGKKPHDYHNLLGSSDQIMAKFDAWQEIECRIEELLQTTPTQPEPK